MISSRRSPLLAALASLAMVSAGIYGLVDARRQSRWKPVEAKPVVATSASNQTFLTFLETLDGRSRARRHYGVKVRYKYAVDGREYEGASVEGRMTEEQARIEAGAFPLDRPFTVYVDPASPATSARVRASAGWSALLALLGAASLVGSLLFSRFGGGGDD